MKLKALVVTLLFPLYFTLALEAVENSVIPQIERWEKVEQLPMNCYSKNQFLEIVAALEQKEERIRVATYNVLFNLYDHNLDKLNRWPQRLPRIVELIEEMQPDILGVQELYPDQLLDLFPYLEETFDFYAPASQGGELNGIFYRKDRFELIDSQGWRMSTTSKIAISETLTMLQLKDLKTGKCLAVFNTHLAFSKIEERDFQARFIADKIHSYAEKMPVILTGDMNTFPHRLDLDKLPFYDGDYIHNILTKHDLRDAKEVSLLGHLGPISTFTNATTDGIPFKGIGTPGVFLDHIYVSDGITVLLHAVQSGTVQGHFPSDHMPVLIDCILKQ
jgi:endonuclease/exonuclease/phosphatase family metal-dependent hydrolase